MFNWLKWHQSLLNWVSPSFIGDIIGAVGGAITGNPLGAIGLGANIIGGCCGTTPEHIHRLVEVLK